MDQHDERTRQRVAPSSPAPYGVTDKEAPDYRAIARQFANLSAAATRHARATGNDDLGRLAERLDHCVDAMLDDLDRERDGARQPH